jgi:xyloglucan-specific endo-beta-1,4-glucanase
MKVFSFVPADGSWKFTFNADLKVFFNYLAQSQGYPINSQNLIGEFTLCLLLAVEIVWRLIRWFVVLQQGTEAFTGGQTKYEVKSYSASVNV